MPPVLRLGIEKRGSEKRGKTRGESAEKASMAISADLAINSIHSIHRSDSPALRAI
jgi:hypothetical protein